MLPIVGWITTAFWLSIHLSVSYPFTSFFSRSNSGSYLAFFNQFAELLLELKL